jgi:cobalt-zinc-cadmium efflux system outer membrane protein
LEAQVEVAEGNLMTARTWSNPQISMDREGVDGLSGDGSETIIQLEQTFDVSGRRSLNRRGAEADLRAATLAAVSERARIDTEARQRFYQALAADEALTIELRYRTEIEDLLAVTERRRAGGDASRYDVERVRQEYLAADVASTEAEARAFEARQSLAALVGPQRVADSTLIGRLLPGNEQEATSAVPPAIAALEAEAEAAVYRKRSAARYTPDVTVGAGFRQIEGPFDETGLLLSFSVPLPLFDRNQGEYRARAAEAGAAAARLRLAEDQIAADLAGLRFRATSLRDAAERYDAGALTSAAELRRIATAAFSGGEIAVFEVIDALRSARDAERQSLALRLEARTAALAIAERLPETNR